MRRRILGWVVLEMLIAVAIAVAIVAWTWPRKKRPHDAERGNDER